MQCRYCLSDENEYEMIEPCNCQGSLKSVHQQCLTQWIKKSNKKFELVQLNKSSLDLASYQDNVHKSSSINSNIQQEYPIYSIECEICKCRMKCYQVYQNTLINSFFNTLKFTFLDLRNLPYVIMHFAILYYMLNKCNSLFYYIYQIFTNFRPNTKLLMRFGNEFAVLCAVVWYINDILKFYKNIYWEQRNVVVKFLPNQNRILVN